jgi:RNA polymerase sigma-70 factor (ECF subfamily)
VAEDAPFPDLVRRVRAGDAQACAELVRRYEPAIRLAAHVRLTDPGLRRLLDSADICQSVLANFFLRAAAGELELNTPAQLVRLLKTMAANRVINHARKEHAARRDVRRLRRGLCDEGQFADPGAGPAEVAAVRELLAETLRRLPPGLRRVAERRGLGHSWPEIAADLGEPADTLRVRLTRELDRILAALGVEG